MIELQRMPDTVAVIMTAFSAYLNSEIDWAKILECVAGKL